MSLNRKIMVLVIISLFIGTSVVSATEKIAIENDANPFEKQENSFGEIAFDRTVQFLMKRSRIPAFSGCIIKNNSVVWSKGYGLSDIRQGKKASDDTIYMIGSVSKSITATAVMQLYEQGLFELDDDVNEYFSFSLRNPQYPNINITFRMLLSHQSSLAGHSLNESFNYIEKMILMYKQLNSMIQGDFPMNEEPYPFLKELLIPGGNWYESDIWADFPPGENFSYSNWNFVILGYLVELLSGQPFEQYCKENIFIPLGMMNTSFTFEDLDASRLATPYICLAKFYIPIPQYDMPIFNPAGGIRTNVQDLSHFLIAHMNNGEYNEVQILDKETVELIHTVQYPNNSGLYGLGWFKLSIAGESYDLHPGGTYGFSSFMISRNSDNVGVICFFNQCTTPYMKSNLVLSIEVKISYLIPSVLFMNANKF